MAVHHGQVLRHGLRGHTLRPLMLRAQRQCETKGGRRPGPRLRSLLSGAAARAAHIGVRTAGVGTEGGAGGCGENRISDWGRRRKKQPLYIQLAVGAAHEALGNLAAPQPQYRVEVRGHCPSREGWTRRGLTGGGRTLARARRRAKHRRASQNGPSGVVCDNRCRRGVGEDIVITNGATRLTEAACTQACMARRHHLWVTRGACHSARCRFL